MKIFSSIIRIVLRHFGLGFAKFLNINGIGVYRILNFKMLFKRFFVISKSEFD